MKIRFRLSILVISIMTVVAVGAVILLLRQTSGISYNLNIRSLEHLTDRHAEFWKGREDGYIRILHTLAKVMGDYESIPAEERRDRYDDMLRIALKAEPQMTALYTVWKPNAIDNMDDSYIGRTGSGPAGQYAISYSKENGKMSGYTSRDIGNVMAHISGQNAHKERVYNPVSLKINGKDTFIIKMVVPITNDRTNEVVGGLGCFLAVDTIQHIVENTVKTNDEIAMMAMYSGNGTILAHSKSERVGKQMLDAEVELGDSIQTMYQAVQEGEIYRDTVYNPEINENIIFVLKPFHIGGSDHNWSMLIGVPESYVLKEVNTITKFIVMLVVIAILITAVVVFVFLGTITKPIVRITDTFKDISEGKGDLTRVITEKGNDEIAYMSHYFNRTLRKLKNLVITIKRQAAMLSDASNELAGVMIQTTVAISQIITGLDNVKNKVLDQSSAEAQSTVVIEHISKNIDRLKEYMDQQASNVAQTSFIIEENIGNAMKEQDEDEKQILEAVSQISKVTRQVNDELTELHNDSYEALLGGRYIELVTEEINTGINEAAEGADQINTVVSRVNELSIRNRKNIDVLLEGVSMFKTV